MFTPLALSHFEKHGDGCSQFWQFLFLFFFPVATTATLFCALSRLMEMPLQTFNITLEFCVGSGLYQVWLFSNLMFSRTSPHPHLTVPVICTIAQSENRRRHSKANMLILPGGLYGVMEETEKAMVSEQRLLSGLRFGSTCQAMSDVLLWGITIPCPISKPGAPCVKKRYLHTDCCCCFCTCLSALANI